jgi:hypothetical protein
MVVRPLPVLLVFALALSAPAADPVVHKDVPGTLKEAKALRVPAFVVLTKTKASAPPGAVSDPRIMRTSRSFACAAVVLTPALAKQYELDGDAHILLLDPDGAVLEKFAADAGPEPVLAAMTKQADAARTELLKSVKSGADAKARKTALAGLTRIGPFAEDLIPFLTDPDAPIKDAARKALAAMPPESTMTPLLDALKSDDSAVRTAVHPFLIQATGYKAAPLKVWQSGTAEERAAAWEKWNAAVQAQFPPLNRAVLAFCEKNMGVQVNNGECAMLVSDAYAACRAQPMVKSGETYIWGRQLKSGEPVLPGDIAQFEKAKFGYGSYPHHTAVIRKVLAPGKFETLEQNVGGKTVKPGKLDLTALQEGTVVIYRPQPK